MGKSNPLNDEDLAEFIALQSSYVRSEKSWIVDVTSIDQTSFNLSARNPHRPNEERLRDPLDIIAQIVELDIERAAILESIRGML